MQILKQYRLTMVYTKADLDEFRQMFIEAGITDEDEMVRVLNTLDQLAEIGYLVFRKKQTSESSFSK